MSETKLTQRGYVVRKDALTDAETHMIRRDLLVTPVNPVRDKMIQERMRWDPDAAAAMEDESFKVYRENAAKFYLPPFYATEKFGAPAVNQLKSRGAPIQIDFAGSLRPQQQEVADKTVHHLNQHGGGLLQLRCGFGKTIIALHLFARLGVKTLVMVHKEFLMNQWRERIAQFLPGARVGTLQAKTMDVEDKDIVIGMLQSVSTGKYPQEVYEPFGVCCFDECHHLGAAVFSRAMDIGRTRYMLGLSATPDRKDGLRKVFDWQLGAVICKVEAKVTQKVFVQEERFEDPAVSRSPCGTTVIRMGARSVLYDEKPTFRCKLLGHVVDSKPRTEFIVNIIRSFTSDPLRRVLILSERRKHLQAISEYLNKSGVENGFYWGGVKQSELEEASKKQVVLGTYHMASEGMDVPELNTVVLASPKSDVKQSVGRILRKTDHPVLPTVVDVIDQSLPCFARQVRTRTKFYRECGFVFDKDAEPDAGANMKPTSDSTSTPSSTSGAEHPTPKCEHRRTSRKSGSKGVFLFRN
jgi:superfamily II DNA or RNA helicase